MKKEILRQAVLMHPEGIMQPFDEMLHLNGFDAICAFSDWFGGRTSHVPIARTIFKECVRAQIRKEFNGYNFDELSVKYGLSKRQARWLLGYK